MGGFNIFQAYDWPTAPYYHYKCLFPIASQTKVSCSFCEKKYLIDLYSVMCNSPSCCKIHKVQPCLIFLLSVHFGIRFTYMDGSNQSEFHLWRGCDRFTHDGKCRL